MRLATFKQKGMTYVSQLALENVKALKAIIQWNHEHGIRFFRWHYLDCQLLLAHERLYVQTVPGFSLRHVMFIFLASIRPGCLVVHVSDAQAKAACLCCLT